MMTRRSLERVWAVALLLCVASSVTVSLPAKAQTEQSVEVQLIDKAHGLESLGKHDMAKQVWKQVLLGDPRQPEALAGVARDDKFLGNLREAQDDLNKLRAVNPNDPNIEKIQALDTQQDTAGKLQEEGRLAQAGQYGRAMDILHEVYGTHPPAGDAALTYYETEAGTDEGRPHAVAGLRALMDQYPKDDRYQIALGKILTYNPRTRAEGRKLLEKHPNDPAAQAALQKSFEWDRRGSNTAPRVDYNQSAQVPAVPAPPPGQVMRPGFDRPSVRRSGQAVAGAYKPYRQASRGGAGFRNPEERAAYAALNAKRLAEAERLFQALLDKNAHDYQAAAGLGYVRMNQGNFPPAISLFEQAQQNGDKDPAIERALDDSRFYNLMKVATDALNANNLVVAQQQFSAAHEKRPNDPSALLGLGGTLLKEQQNERAIGVFETDVRIAPGNEDAWRGLFMAQYGAGRYNDALAIDRRIPPAVKRQLAVDPDYVRTLASVYMALGREGDAQRVLYAALQLPFPANGAGLKADVQLQYAALLSTAHHNEQAIALYKQVLVAEPNNTSAWVGLVQNEHQIGEDAAAYDVIEQIRANRPPVYAAAMSEAGFETTVAAVYTEQGHDDYAAQVLEQLLASQRAQGKQPFAPAEIQLAGIYMRRGDSVQAYALYKSAIESNGNNADAWSGLLDAMHASGHDQEALAQLQAIPEGVRKDLENNAGYLQSVGSIYASLGDSQEALLFFSRVQQHYASQRVQAPAELDVQEAWLLYNSHNDRVLLRHLLALGDRKDLTDRQRLTVQTIWANFAVRRANQASAAGNYRLAVAVLNAAAQSFPRNQDVLRALASGYASAGMPKEAIAIFRSQNLNAASPADYRAAVGAALAGNDLHDAEIWLRFGLDQYPRDPQMLVLAGRFEAARGDANRAAEYYRAALVAMPAPNPGLQLASEMAHPAPQADLPSHAQPKDLASLLSQAEAGPASRQAAEPRPYLPSFTGGTGDLPVSTNQSAYYGAHAYGAATSGEGAIDPGSGYMPGGAGVGGAIGSPDIGGYPTVSPQAQPSSPPSSSKPGPTLNDYRPARSRLELPRPLSDGVQFASATKVLHLHANRAVEAKLGPYVSYNPAAGVPHFVGAQTQLGDGVVARLGRSASGSTAYITPAVIRIPDAHAVLLHAIRFQQDQAGQPPTFSPRQNPAPPPTAADGTPIVPYAATAHPVAKPAPSRQTVTRPPSATVRARAAAIRENQASATPQMTGVSHPPTETYDTAPAAKLNDVQYGSYGTPQYGAGYQQGSPQGPPQGQVPQPTRGATSGGYSSSAPQYGTQQTNDSTGQQYPQPGTHGTSSATSGTRRPKRTRTDSVSTVPAPARDNNPAPQQAPLQYPNPGEQLENMGPPQVGSPYPLGQAPSDYDLQQRNLPPLRAYYDPRVDNRRPLTPREQTELDLAQIEGSYSGWLGGSVIGRYRSGTAGIDRLAALEVPFEASFVFNNEFRLSIIPQAVFLNSGTLNTAGGNLGTGPVLGTYLGNAPSNPAQQFASGVGGEVQLSTNTIALAVGTTPFEFLVTNLIGRGRWRPGNGHFTLYGGRDAVEETQLSYAGLRDPGTATTTYGGNVWGGVVLTGGGVRFDSGDERAGFYLQGEGGVLTGYHVLQNQKADGLAGAYFRVKTWPKYGTLNIGGVMYGEHFTYNERGETYGLGGYFSPDAYFLAAVPVTFTGHYGTDLHYSINGSLGVQTFQEDNETYFPLDPGLLAVAGCTSAQLTNHSCGLPVNSSTGVNFSFDTEVSYRATDHWFVGAFLSANNTNNYDTVSGGFFARYTFRPQYFTADYPTGLFPVQGFRPLRVP